MTPFWDWALGIYAKPGVAEACLELQDRDQQCTAYLLWAAWASDQGLVLCQDSLVTGQALASQWESEVLQPLRHTRRHLKAAIETMPDPAREALRAQVKATELFAEQTLIEALTKLAGNAPSAPAETRLQALVRAGALWSPPPTKDALSVLSQQL
jgi:uncharacterized protein (TIGR02444 family)